MSESDVTVGADFPLQFVWQLPDGDYLRVIFRAEVLSIDSGMDRYVVRLTEFKGGRQESPAGYPRQRDSFSTGYWQRVLQLQTRRIQVAYEAADGRPLRLRLSTLTGENRFFTRYDGPLPAWDMPA